jgi:hypothetical protein
MSLFSAGATAQADEPAAASGERRSGSGGIGSRQASGSLGDPIVNPTGYSHGDALKQLALADMQVQQLQEYLKQAIGWHVGELRVLVTRGAKQDVESVALLGGAAGNSLLTAMITYYPALGERDSHANAWIAEGDTLKEVIACAGDKIMRMEAPFGSMTDALSAGSPRLDPARVEVFLNQLRAVSR